MYIGYYEGKVEILVCKCLIFCLVLFEIDIYKFYRMLGIDIVLLVFYYF